ncbi:MAG: hypothetical protein H8D52_00990, partial [Gammaproteobacteria bacterium]|nr:hypothetical protein [Gammaproteobacteria bacterium]
MSRSKVIVNQNAVEVETGAWDFVPSLQLTQGQPPPVAANGGLSYMSFQRDGDAGTAEAIEAALRQIARGDGQTVIDMLDNAPAG